MKVKRLIELLSKLPPDALVWGYESEDIGISIASGTQVWWIRAYYNIGKDHEEYTEGFGSAD